MIFENQENGFLNFFINFYGLVTDETFYAVVENTQTLAKQNL